VADCPWYDRGLCKHGPRCRNRHTRRTLCEKYLAGVCPDGPECKRAHPTFGAPITMPRNEGPAYGGAGAGMGGGGDGGGRDATGVTCYRCGEKGHYANRCQQRQQGQGQQGQAVQQGQGQQFQPGTQGQGMQGQGGMRGFGGGMGYQAR